MTRLVHKQTILKFHDGRTWIISSSGSQYWYLHRMLHREGDKPAVIWANGSQYWYLNGELHREGDKPAIVRADGSQEWFIDGIKQIENNI
jgi:hypothetical protein